MAEFCCSSGVISASCIFTNVLLDKFILKVPQDMPLEVQELLEHFKLLFANAKEILGAE